jgi:hypothetical protein
MNQQGNRYRDPTDHHQTRQTGKHQSQSQTVKRVDIRSYAVQKHTCPQAFDLTVRRHQNTA